MRKPCGYNEYVTSIHGVAKRAKVSPATARRAIFEPQLLSQTTLERVTRAIQDLNYEPDRTAGARRAHGGAVTATRLA
jgi:LacI family transcriptional regulator